MKATTALQIVTFAVDVGGDVVLVHTRDGSTFRHPLARLPRVHSAGTFERSAGVIADDGFTVTWAVGGTLSVFQLAWDRLRTDTFSSCTAGYRDLSVLTPRQRSIVALTVLEADVYNGGFLQFITNQGFDVAATALSALNEIGARHAAAAIAGQLAIVRGLDARAEPVALESIGAALRTAELAEVRRLDAAYAADVDDVERCAVCCFWSG